jgi:hypothetical protein
MIARKVTVSVSSPVIVYVTADVNGEPRRPPEGAAIATAETSSVAVASANAEVGAIAEIKPKPSADTATSEMRLRSVFVDICFLSISRSREFPSLGFELIS